MESSSDRRYAVAAWIVVGLFVAFCLLTLDYNGPFFDEGIYVTAGERNLEGYGASDQYLSWFAGSMLWPTLSALGFRVAGLAGARAFATLFVTVALVATMLATRNLFGRPAAFWTILALALSGPLLALGRLAVYDPPALAGIALAFWAITMLVRENHRSWILLAGLGFVFALFSKYPSALMLLPLIGLVLVLRRARAPMDLAIFGFVTLAVVLILYIPLRAPLSQLGTRLAPQEILRQPTEVTLASVLYFGGLPFVLALPGWLLARDRRLLATVLLSALLIWPAYHLRQAFVVSLSKHVVLGFVFGYPLIGLGLSIVWERWRHRAAAIAIGLVLLMTGGVQWQQLDNIWPDVRPAAQYLVTQVQPGDKLLINDSWPYTLYLYTSNRIDQPQDVIDIYSREEAGIGLCDYNWFVDSDYTPRWPQEVLDALLQCGTFRPVFSTTSSVSLLNFGFDLVTAPVKIDVWHNSTGGVVNARD